ncbi:uncharacterized protein LOC120338975 [Styela clava]
MKEETSAEPDLLKSTSDICRDFLRNVCYRDKRCKFRHLTSDELDASVDTKADSGSTNVVYEFCHDFQNQGCDRPSCKFIHCAVDIESTFREKGFLPLRLKYEYELGVQELFVKSATPSGSCNTQEKIKPVCRDFMQRQCRRGKKCRFAHVDQNCNMAGEEFHPRQGQNSDKFGHVYGENGEKRIRLYGDCSSNETLLNTLQPDVIRHIKEENTLLRKEVANLRKQVTGLSATNEVLLEQNAQFRLQKRVLAEAATPSYSQSNKTYGIPSSMSVSVPIAMSLNMPGQNQQIQNNPALTGATLITSDPLTVTPLELVNSSPAQQPVVSVRTHAGVPAQAHIQISRSIPQNSPGLVNNIGNNNNRILDDLQSLNNHQANVGANQGGLHTNVPVLQQANLNGQSVANFSLTQNTIPITRNTICSIPSITTSVSGSVLYNSTQQIMNGTLTGQNSLPLNRSQATQNMAAAGGLVVQTSRNITVEADAESIGHINRNIATAQMTHATLVTTNQQNQSSTGPSAAASISASTIAAVAAQVIAQQQGTLTQPNNDIGTAQISVPAVPCGTIASAIVPVTITTSLPMAMVPSLSIENSHAGLLATRMEGVAQTHARVSMVNTCPASVNSISLSTPHQVVNALNGRRVVGGQQQLNAPINFTINPVASVPQQPGQGMHV